MTFENSLDWEALLSAERNSACHHAREDHQGALDATAQMVQAVATSYAAVPGCLRRLIVMESVCRRACQTLECTIFPKLLGASTVF